MNTFAQRGRNIMRGLKVTCPYHNSELVDSFTCSIKLINRTSELYNFDLYAKENVSCSWIHVKVRTYYKYTVKYRKTLIDIDEDLCAIFAKKDGLLLTARITANESNVIGCPFSVSMAFSCLRKKRSFSISFSVSLSAVLYICT